MASDDAKEKMRLQLSLREIYAKSTLYYYGTNHSPATPQQQRPTPTTPSTAPAAAPTRRWELAELEPASPAEPRPSWMDNFHAGATTRGVHVIRII